MVEEHTLSTEDEPGAGAALVSASTEASARTVVKRCMIDVLWYLLRSMSSGKCMDEQDSERNRPAFIECRLWLL
jgi:hypothetical protein